MALHKLHSSVLAVSVEKIVAKQFTFMRLFCDDRNTVNRKPNSENRQWRKKTRKLCKCCGCSSAFYYGNKLY